MFWHRQKKKTVWDKVSEAKDKLGVAAAIVASMVYFFGFVQLDLTQFKQTDLTVANQQGQLYIQWELAYLPETPAILVYYIDGVQVTSQHYPQGLLVERGNDTKWIESYIIPPLIYNNPGTHDFVAKWTFTGIATAFIPETVTFSTEITVGVQNEEYDRDGSSYSVPNGFTLIRRHLGV